MKRVHNVILRPAVRWAVIAVVLLAATPFLPPATVVADDAVVSACTEAAFDTALNAVQSSGGGTLTFSCAGTITFTSQKSIASDVTIDGGNSIVIDGNGTTRLFAVGTSGSLTLDSITLQHGLVGFQDEGGAIHNTGSLTIVDSTFTENEADDGGAIWNEGTTTVTGSTFTDNLATSDQTAFGGAIASEGPLTVNTSEFTSNAADAWGGAIYMSSTNDHPLIVTDSTFTSNSAGSYGGALMFDIGSSLILTGGTFTSNSATVGGAISFAFSTAATIVSSTFTTNTTTSGGGAIHNFSDGRITIIDSTLTGNTAGTSGGAAIYGANGGRFTLIGSTVSDNSADDDGGAFWGGQASLTIIASTISGNSTNGSGGAIADRISGGSRTIRASAFSNNSAGINGGAIFNETSNASITDSTFSGNTAEGDGGALYNDTGTFNIVRSTFTGNVADGGGGAFASDTTRDHDITASTFNANQAVNGGAIFATFDAVDIVASTFSGNAATSNGGALYTTWGGIASQSSIVAANTAPTGPNCFRLNNIGEGGAVDPRIIFSGGYNVSNDASCGFTETGDIENSATASVAALTDNGGPTQTMLPTGADALDNADCTLSSPIDQRGVTRPATNCDRGAVETASTVPVQILAFYNQDAIADEGSPVKLVAVAVGSAGASLGYDFDCDDNGSYETQGTEDGNSGSANCTFPDDGSYDVNVQVCDGANCDTDTLSIVVNNVAPTITGISHSSSVPEGTPATITVTASDPAGVNDPLTVNADCDDSGDFETVGSGLEVQCTFDDEGVYNVPLEVDDGDGGRALATATITVDNANPTITSVTNSGPTNESLSATITITASDNDPLMYAFDCDNDGAFEIGPQVANSADCTFPDDGDLTVPVQVTDDDGGLATSSTIVTVNNLDPTIFEITFTIGASEGDPVAITISATDPAGANDPLLYEFDCDNDGAYEVGPQSSSSTNCTFGDNGHFLVPVRVADDDGGVATDSVLVFITNVAPTVDEPSVNPSPSNEGQSVVASATFSDPGTGDSHTCTVDYGGGPQPGTIDGLTCTGPAYVYLDDDPSGSASDDYIVTVVVTDDDDGSHEATTLHTVNNVAPVIDEITTNGPVPQGQPVTITINASDVGTLDTLTYRFDCDNDTVYETAGVGNQGTCSINPAAASSTIGVRVEDDDLGVATDTVVITQSLKLCVNLMTGHLSAVGSSGTCAGTRVALTLPAPYPVTLCRSSYESGLRVSNAGACTFGERPHVVPNDGSLNYCQHLRTLALRAPLIPGQCLAVEIPGIIPG